jgi:hypothetical protein
MLARNEKGRLEMNVIAGRNSPSRRSVHFPGMEMEMEKNNKVIFNKIFDLNVCFIAKMQKWLVMVGEDFIWFRSKLRHTNCQLVKYMTFTCCQN